MNSGVVGLEGHGEDLAAFHGFAMPALLPKGVGDGMKLSGNCHRRNHEITGGGREEFLSLEPCGELTRIEPRDEKISWITGFHLRGHSSGGNPVDRI